MNEGLGKMINFAYGAVVAEWNRGRFGLFSTIAHEKDFLLDGLSHCMMNF